jgi:hypothetical protein
MLNAFHFYAAPHNISSLLCRFSVTLLVWKYGKNRLRASGWFDYKKHYNGVQSRSEKQVCNKAYGEGKSTKRRNEERTFDVRSKDQCIQVRVYNGCYAGLQNQSLNALRITLYMHLIYLSDRM